MIPTLFAMACILAIILMAQWKGQNGKLLALGVGLIAALGGVSLGSLLPELLSGIIGGP